MENNKQGGQKSQGEKFDYNTSIQSKIEEARRLI